MSKSWCCPMSGFAFLGYIFLICFFHPAALSSAFTNENTMGWLFCKLLCRRKWVRCEQWLFEPSPSVTPAKSLLLCVVCSDLRLLRKGLSVGITLLILHGAGRTFEGVWRHFHREELVWQGGGEWRWEFSIPCVHFHLECSVQFPREWPMLYLKPSLYRARQRQLCRDGSSFLTLQSSVFCCLILEENLSCHSCLASLTSLSH